MSYSQNFQREFERLGHRMTLLGFAVVIFLIIAAPILALAWRNNPFLGVFVKQTLLVNDNAGEDWGDSRPESPRRTRGPYRWVRGCNT